MRIRLNYLHFEFLEARRLLVGEIEPNDLPTQATEFPVGEQRLEGSLSSTSDVDWFKVNLSSGQRLSVAQYREDNGGVTGSAAKIPRFEIRDESGRLWAGSDVGRNDGFTAVASGYYYAGIFHDNTIQDFVGNSLVTAWI